MDEGAAAVLDRFDMLGSERQPLAPTAVSQTR